MFLPNTETAERVSNKSLKARLSVLLRSVGMRHGIIMGAAMVVAGGLDYGVNVLAGRWLQPVEYGVFISVTAILQVLLLLSIAIRMVVAFYTAELSAVGDPNARLSHFVRGTWRWAWHWGVTATALLFAVSPLLARTLQLPTSWPMRAGSLMVLFLFLRETLYGALQGIQAFGGLGLVQVTQAFLRLMLAAAFIWAGWGASGAIIAQPLGCVFALALALWWLRAHFKSRGSAEKNSVSWHYSACTVLGLAAFGLLTNLDALFVKLFYSPHVAGHYGPVVTLAKICLFLPWAIGIVLFPKVTQRQANGRDPRPILLVSLAAALLPGLGITTLYFAAPAILVRSIFTAAYADPGMVLGLASLAATLYAGLFIWLNYSLSLERRGFVYSLIAVVGLEATAMVLFGRDSLVHMTAIMVGAGLFGNIAGFLTTWSPITSAAPIEAELAGD